MPKLKAGTIQPTPAEDAAITAAAMADPDAVPFTDTQWEQAKPLVKQQFASVWDALADTPQQAASMKARSARRMALAEVIRERGIAQGELMPYPVAIEPGNDTTAWGVAVPDLPGCFSAGDTLEEAMLQAEDAITAWIEAALDDGRDIPAPSSVEGLRAAHPEFRGWQWALVKAA